MVFKTINSKGDVTMNTTQSTLQRVEAPQTTLTALAWVVIVIGSMVPVVIMRLFVPVVGDELLFPAWLAWAQVILLAVLWAVSWVWSTIKPLRGLILALLAFCIGAFFISPAIRESAAYTNWISGASWGAALVSSPITGKFAPVVLMALTVFGSGLGRKGLFLGLGNLNAPAQRSRIFGIKETMPWTQLFKQFILIFVAIFAIALWMLIRPDIGKFSQALIFLPACLIAAAINGLAEEFQFRSVLLARLEPWVKPGQAMMMSAVLFASLHYYTGTPGGLLGAPLNIFFGWVASKSVLETRGLFWAWLLHFIADFMIYFFAAMTI
jgi:membrane protease YdiL (CAAX protease family)